MARRGRPKGGDSAETRQRIIIAARDEFASCGFDGASVATIATRSELAPSAVYHYFGSKVALYEEVFAISTSIIWDAVRDVATVHETVVENVEAMVSWTVGMSVDLLRYSRFLALVPMETSLHPEFAHMLELRTKWQDETFGALAEIGVKTGELAGFTVDGATEMLRSLVMGWFLETYHSRSRSRSGVSGDAVVTTIRLLAERG